MMQSTLSINWTEKIEIERGYYICGTFFTILSFILIAILIILIVKYHENWNYVIHQMKFYENLKKEYMNKIKTTKSTKDEKNKKIFELEDKIKGLEEERDYWKASYYENKMNTNDLANAIRDGIAKAKYEEKNGIFGSADDMFDRKK